LFVILFMKIDPDFGKGKKKGKKKKKKKKKKRQ
jgi:hypothetical protein